MNLHNSSPLNSCSVLHIRPGPDLCPISTFCHRKHIYTFSPFRMWKLMHVESRIERKNRHPCEGTSEAFIWEIFTLVYGITVSGRSLCRRLSCLGLSSALQDSDYWIGIGGTQYLQPFAKSKETNKERSRHIRDFRFLLFDEVRPSAIL